MAGSLAIQGSRITSEAAAAPDAPRIDLDGTCVVPGLADSHVHFPTWSLGLRQARLEGARSLEEALERVAAALPNVQPGGWLRGLGWRDGDWPDPPTRAALDRVAGDVPVALMSKDYHSLWLNGAALARADAPLETPGGGVERDEHGEPLGVLRENAAWSSATATWPSVDEMLEAVREGLRVASARGVTAIHDKDGWLWGVRGLRAAARDGRADRAGVAVVPLGSARGAERARPTLGVRPRAAAYGLPEGLHGRHARLGHRSTAGRLGRGDHESRRARARDPARRRGALPIAVHAIGDAANRAALDAFEATRELWAPLGLRQRIEHAQLLAPEEVERFEQIGVAASVQFSHAPSDRDLADRLWEGREGAYAYRSLLDAGALLANGSDAPVEELDPLAGIAAAVLRTLDERPAWARSRL